LERAVILLSGGLDSATTLYIARDKGYDCRCLIFDYNQRHKREIESAKKIARLSGFAYKEMKISMSWGTSALLDRHAGMPQGRATAEMKKGIPSTYVPARNTIFISLAAGMAEAIGARRIFIGANALDYSGYPDCRSIYFRTFNKLLKVGTAAGVRGKSIRIETPLLKMTKGQIIRTGLSMGVPYEYTWSCYKGGKMPCMQCDSCLLRKKGFREAGVEDPLLERK